MYLIASVLLAQTPQDAATLKQFADEVSQKDFRWWFAIVFGILITATTFIVKWLIAIVKDFIIYMKEDRLKNAVLLERVTMVLERLEEDKRLQIVTGQVQANQIAEQQARRIIAEAESHTQHPSPSERKLQ